MAESTPKSYSTDPALYLYTSLTSGSSHVVTATSRLETILKANRIPFKALDIATDEKARMLWGRRSGKDESGRVRKIPGLVQMGLVVGDLVEIEEWNEYGELKEHLTIYNEGGTPTKPAVPNLLNAHAKAPLLQDKNSPEPAAVAKSSTDAETLKPVAGAEPTAFTLAMRQVGQEAAQKAKDSKKKITETFTGVGEAQGKPKDVEKDRPAAVLPSPLLIQSLPDRSNIVAPTILQSPTTTAWNKAPDSIPPPASSANETEKSQEAQSQSPTFVSWKSSDTDAPVITHRGSSISSVSKGDIRQIEEDCAIPEEDEDESEHAS